MEYWEIIRRTRILAGYSIRAWAAACGVSATCAVAWEAGRYCPNYAHRERISSLASTGACRYEHERNLVRRELAQQLHNAAADHARNYARYPRRIA